MRRPRACGHHACMAHPRCGLAAASPSEGATPADRQSRIRDVRLGASARLRRASEGGLRATATRRGRPRPLAPVACACCFRFSAAAALCSTSAALLLRGLVHLRHRLADLRRPRSSARHWRRRSRRRCRSRGRSRRRFRPSSCQPGSTSALPWSTRSTLAVIKRLDLARRFGAALREAAHLAGHHREAAALFAGTRGFHRGVEGEDVGLEGDARRSPR